ncbi:hypothetical protein LXL04_007731 [Taraxacum kok-saghyz]
MVVDNHHQMENKLHKPQMKMENDKENHQVIPQLHTTTHLNWDAIVDLSCTDEDELAEGEISATTLSPTPFRRRFTIPRVTIRSRNRCLRLRDESNEEDYIYTLYPLMEEIRVYTVPPQVFPPKMMMSSLPTLFLLDQVDRI